jgi:hypothetical protein
MLVILASIPPQFSGGLPKWSSSVDCEFSEEMALEPKRDRAFLLESLTILREFIV